MSYPIIIIEAGGFGRHALSILRMTTNWDDSRFLGFIDDGQPDIERINRLNTKLLGSTEILTSLPKNTHYVIGIGNGRIREQIDRTAVQAGLQPETVIHPDTSIAPDANIGKGTIICAGARITTNVRLGRQVHLNMNVTVGHDVNIEPYATVFPLVALGGESRIGGRATIGAGATLNPGITTGDDSYVASGAVVLGDIPPSALVAGVPATTKKFLN